MKNILIVISILIISFGYGQNRPETMRTKIFNVLGDTIQIDTVSINPNYFKVYGHNNYELEAQFYDVNFAKSNLYINKDVRDTIQHVTIEYQPLPSYLTKTYSAFDSNLIVSKRTENALLYSSSKNSKNNFLKPFDGLYTRGSLSRGVTVGNNQDAVVNSNFNLQIEGMLSDKVGIRASITDNEVPLQDGGYTQRLDEFDKVYIELFSKNWTIKAGDIDLFNTESYFMKFQKKISGIAVSAKLKHKKAETKIYGSGALVRGKFHSHNFNGIDGNQGPYKLLGPNNELSVLVVSGGTAIQANEESDKALAFL